ncbi:MAG: ABC transporter substrate-binding protein [Desulfobacteraceae bacterium IS3]|nr:MAG: ABC transporter substrate-binding protein [Desulfobacteraceae bacterium IS3]
MKKIIFLSFFCLVYPTSVFSGIYVSVYADDDYPPYSYKEEGKLTGIYTEILMTAFSRMEGYKVNIKPVPWKRGLDYLEKGTGFALYPPYYRPKERPYIKPYSIPILGEKIVVFCKENVLAQPRPDWPKDYYGLTIGNNAGFLSGGDDFWDAVKSGKIKVEEAKGTRLNILKLGENRFDCYMNDRLSTLWELNRLKKNGEYDEGGRHVKIEEGATVSVEQAFLGFTDRDKGKFYYKDDFVMKFNAVIADMKNKGEIQKIIDDFFK